MPPIIALHGFLGRPDDFRALALENLFAPALFSMAPGPLPGFIARLNRACPDNSIVLGYSMGARLALQALISSPKKYRAAIILAANPGLTNLSDRSVRYANDILWAHRFLHMDWREVLQLWNQQPVLKTSQPRALADEEIARASLAQVLRYFSLGVQENLRPLIDQLDVPILWMTPRSEINNARGFTLTHPRSQLHILDGVGHRFLLEQPRETAARIKHFLRTL